MSDLSNCIIMVVDDTEANIDLLVEILGDDYKIRVAMDGETALEVIREDPPDLILLDVMMPEMDGYEVCRQLKQDENLKRIPVIFITAMNEIEDETKGLEIGAIDYITKPINASIVKARIKNHLELKYYRDHLKELVKERTAHLKTALKELEKSKEEVEAANQAKSLFLANMSHELRTPMHGIITATELVLEYDLTPDIKEVVDIVHKSSYALIGLIDNILNVSASDEGRLELIEMPFQLDDLLNELPKTYFQKGVERQIQINFSIVDHIVPKALIGDKEKLQTVLINLLDNAAKFSTRDPVVTIGVKKVQTSENDLILVFFVRDNGIGIASEHHHKIFEPFIQVDSSHDRTYDGAGVGLAVCSRLVSLMGGEIWVESEPGQGSTFYFTVTLKRQQILEPSIPIF